MTDIEPVARAFSISRGDDPDGVAGRTRFAREYGGVAYPAAGFVPILVLVVEPDETPVRAICPVDPHDP